MKLLISATLLATLACLAAGTLTPCGDSKVCVPIHPARRCPRNSKFHCDSLTCRCDRGYKTNGDQCVLACPDPNQHPARRNDPAQVATCRFSSGATICECRCRDVNRHLVNGRCVCKPEFVLFGHACVLPCAPDRTRNAVTGVCECTAPKEEVAGVCVPPCDDDRTRDPVTGICECTSPLEEIMYTCVPPCDADRTRNMATGVCECTAPTEEFNGACVPPCPSDRRRNAATGVCECTSPLVEKNTQCVAPCVGPTAGQPCTRTTPCCEGFCDFQNDRAVTGTCKRFSFQTCPADRNGNNLEKRCVDVEDRPGQATCGEVTCKALCNAVCGDNEDYPPSSCNNNGGGNCHGVFSIFGSRPDFQGGPCCACVAPCVGARKK